MTVQFVAQSPADLPSRDTILSMSGLEYMRGILNGQMAGAPIAGPMSFYLHSVDEGRVAFRGTPGFEHLNPMGAVHGGWYGTLLDSALGCAVATTLPRGRWYTTLEYKVNITRGLTPGTLVEAEARVTHTGRSTGVAEGWLRGVEDGKLYATGSTTCIIMQA
ncbi:MAG: hypothetical protein HLUCCA12_03165 [Rhodobacteraceae bacterium HLUCCA12]|nr:MAG: hypothetical protein HLUCCA12_03165 [Rhodobacteraceae bacterium HLUCCA12]